MRVWSICIQVWPDLVTTHLLWAASSRPSRVAVRCSEYSELGASPTGSRAAGAEKRRYPDQDWKAQRPVGAAVFARALGRSQAVIAGRSSDPGRPARPPCGRSSSGGLRWTDMRSERTWAGTLRRQRAGDWPAAGGGAATVAAAPNAYHEDDAIRRILTRTRRA